MCSFSIQISEGTMLCNAQCYRYLWWCNSPDWEGLVPGVRFRRVHGGWLGLQETPVNRTLNTSHLAHLSWAFHHGSLPAGPDGLVEAEEEGPEARVEDQQGSHHQEQQHSEPGVLHSRVNYGMSSLHVCTGMSS